MFLSCGILIYIAQDDVLLGAFRSFLGSEWYSITYILIDSRWFAENH